MDPKAETMVTQDSMDSSVPAEVRHPDAGNSLMLALQAGQTRALDKLYGLYNTRLFSFISRIVGDAATAEDIVQETWMTLYEHRHDYQTTYRFSTWLFTVARRKALSELRRRDVRGSIRQLISGSPEDPVHGGESESNLPQHTFIQPDASADESILRTMIERALDSLTKTQKEIVVLRDVEGFENEEIANILGWQIKPGAVRKRIFDARDAFRRAMTGLGFVED